MVNLLQILAEDKDLKSKKGVFSKEANLWFW